MMCATIIPHVTVHLKEDPCIGSARLSEDCAAPPMKKQVRVILETKALARSTDY
jgi:hypothetical protein